MYVFIGTHITKNTAVVDGRTRRDIALAQGVLPCNY